MSARAVEGAAFRRRQGHGRRSEHRRRDVGRLGRPRPAPERRRDGQSRLGSNLRPGDVPLWWPWAKGERVPFHDRSLRIGLAGADISQGPGALRRAAFEATGFVVRHIVELASACGTSPKRFVVSGGGSRHPGWLQAIADVLGQPVVPMAFPEGAALGSAFLARMALGVEASLDDAARWARWSSPVEPAPDWAAAADERYQRWLNGLPSQ